LPVQLGVQAEEIASEEPPDDDEPVDPDDEAPEDEELAPPSSAAPPELAPPWPPDAVPASLPVGPDCADIGCELDEHAPVAMKASARTAPMANEPDLLEALRSDWLIIR